jgi:hypothetical protein
MRDLAPGCILLQRPWHNLKWCYTHRQWPSFWPLMWILQQCILIPLHGSSVVNAFQCLEYPDGPVLMHLSNGRARFTSPDYFPPGFFETCWMLRPSAPLHHRTKETLQDACLDLERVEARPFALPRLLWDRCTKRPIDMTTYSATELRLPGSAFLVGCAWLRATAASRAQSLEPQKVCIVDAPALCKRYPTAMLPKDLLLLAGEHFSLHAKAD